MYQNSQSYQQSDIILGKENVDVRRPSVARQFAAPLFIAIGVIAALVFMLNGVIPTTNPATVFSSSSSAPKFTSTPWSIYKVTSSVKYGSHEDMVKILETYFAYTFSSNFGCNSWKAVGLLLSSFGIHFVDSNVFNDNSARSVDDWSDVGTKLSMDTFDNAFFHNKVQLYVPNLQPTFDAFKRDGVVTMNKLSTSSNGKGTDTNDVAHIGYWIPAAMTMLELVGPSDSLSSDALGQFSEWEAMSCPGSHYLKNTLESYYTSYYAVSKTDETLEWEEETGLLTPLGVQITIPTQSIETMMNTINLVSSISGVDPTLSTFGNNDQDDSCQISSLNLNGVILSYVENKAVLSSTSLTVGDWERDIVQAHDKFVSTANTDYSWDRYLDTHIGINPIPVTDTSECSSYYDLVEDALASNAGNFQYAFRETADTGDGVHYYTATDGLRSWEFNVGGCVTGTGTDLCGCSMDNSVEQYLSSGNATCVPPLE